MSIKKFGHLVPTHLICGKCAKYVSNLFGVQRLIITGTFDLPFV